MTLRLMALSRSRWVALAICMCFLFSQTGAWALPLGARAMVAGPSSQAAILPEIAAFNIPEAFGSIRERFTGNAGKLVIHVQDIHADAEAQANYSKILGFLFSSALKGQKKLIAAEGAMGKVDVSAFQMCRDKEVLTQVADYFLKRALINGSEYYTVLQDPSTQIQGLEDRNLYFRALGAFMTAHAILKKCSQQLEAFDRVLTGLQQRVLHGPLGELMQVATQFKKGQAPITAYIEALDKIAKTAGVITTAYAQFQMALKTITLSKALDLKQVDKERNAMIALLQKKMVKEELAELVKQSLFFRTGRIASAVFYAYLQKTAQSKGFAAKAYPNLFQYMDLVFLQDQVDAKLVLAQCEQIEAAIHGVLAKGQDEKELLSVLKQMDILGALLKLELSRDQWHRYQEHKEQISLSQCVQSVRRLLGQYAIQDGAGTWTLAAKDKTAGVIRIGAQDLEAVAGISQRLDPMEEFYKLTLQRDAVLLANTLAAMDQAQTNVIVQNTGGFHTPAMTALLKAKNISYLVVTPRITQMPDDQAYLARMLNPEIVLENNKLQVLDIWGELGDKMISIGVDGEEKTIRPKEIKNKAVALIAYKAIEALLAKGLDAKKLVEDLAILLDKAGPAMLKAHGGDIWNVLIKAVGQQPLDEGQRAVVSLLVMKVGLERYPDPALQTVSQEKPLSKDAKVYEREFYRGMQMEEAWQAYRSAQKAYQNEKKPSIAQWAMLVHRTRVLAQLQAKRLDERDLLAKILDGVKEGDYVVVFSRPGTAKTSKEIGIKDLNTALGEQANTDIIEEHHRILEEELGRAGLQVKRVKKVFSDYKTDTFAISPSTGIDPEEMQDRIQNVLKKVNDRMAALISEMASRLGRQEKLAQWDRTSYGLTAGIAGPVQGKAADTSNDSQVQAVAQASSAAAIALMGDRPVVVFKQQTFNEKLQEARRARAQLRGTKFARFGGEYSTTGDNFAYKGVAGIPFKADWIKQAVPKELAGEIIRSIQMALDEAKGVFPDATALDEILRRVNPKWSDDARIKVRKSIFAKIAEDKGANVPVYLSKETAEHVRKWVEYEKGEKMAAENQGISNDQWSSILMAIDEAVNRSLTTEVFDITQFIKEKGLIRAGPEADLIDQAYHMRLARRIAEITGMNDFIQQGISGKETREMAENVNMSLAHLNRALNPSSGEELWEGLSQLSSLATTREGNILNKNGTLLSTDVKNPSISSKDRFLVRLNKLIHDHEAPPVLIGFDVKGMGLMNRQLAERNIQWVDAFGQMDNVARQNFLDMLVERKEITSDEKDAILRESSPNAQLSSFTGLILSRAGQSVTKRLRANEVVMKDIFFARLMQAVNLGLLSSNEANKLIDENWLGYIGGDELIIARSQRFMQVVNDPRLGRGDVLLEIQDATSTRAVSVAGAATSYTVQDGTEGRAINFAAFDDLETGTNQCKELEKHGIRGFVEAQWDDQEKKLKWGLIFHHESKVYRLEHVEELIEALHAGVVWTEMMDEARDSTDRGASFTHITPSGRAIMIRLQMPLDPVQMHSTVLEENVRGAQAAATQA